MSVQAATQQITQGAIRAIFEPDNNNPLSNPIVQCVQIKPMGGGAAGPERFRMVFSDIRNFIQSLIATQLNYLVTDGVLKRGSIVRLTKFEPSLVKEKRILIVLGLEVLEEFGECEKIGEPVALEIKPESADVKPQPNAISSNGFYGNKPSQQAAPQQNRSAVQHASSASHGNIYPIEALSPYAHKWTIKARCTHKGDIKTWHNKNGEGKLFSVNLLDDSGEIRATGFNEQCDKLYDLFQEGGVYYISSPCRVQMAKKQFSNVNNDYELTFERDTNVEKAADQENVPQVRYNFTNIGDLQSVEKDTTIDAIGVLKEIGEVSEITSKTTNKPYNKRELTLVDNTGYSVRLTIWGNAANSFDAPPESVIAFKGVKVSDFGGRSLSLLSSGSMSVDPDIDEAHKLKGWYDAQGRQDQFTTHASMGASSGTGRKDDYKLIAQISEEGLGMSENADYFTIKATIVSIKPDNLYYPSCMSDDCNKKVVEVDPGQWRCERCDKTHPRPVYRYITSLSVADHTGQIYLNCFDDVGRIIMGMPADNLAELKENDEEAANAVLDDANCKSLIFRCRAKMDNYLDQQRIRYNAMSASLIDFPTECARLAGIIKKYNMDSDSLFVR